LAHAILWAALVGDILNDPIRFRVGLATLHGHAGAAPKVRA
jgi:hypothetical protein